MHARNIVTSTEGIVNVACSDAEGDTRNYEFNEARKRKRKTRQMVSCHGKKLAVLQYNPV